MVLPEGVELQISTGGEMNGVAGMLGERLVVESPRSCCAVRNLTGGVNLGCKAPTVLTVLFCRKQILFVEEDEYSLL